MTGDLTEKKEISSEDIQYSLEEIPERAWASANYPIIAITSRKTFSDAGEDESMQGEQTFWKQILLQEQFLTPKNTSDLISNPEKTFLFVIHSFKSADGKDTILKAITTSPEEFIRDPENAINYSHHGQPCENRGGGSYPTIDFWRFYDRLTPEEQDIFVIPDTNWRKNFVQKKILNK